MTAKRSRSARGLRHWSLPRPRNSPTPKAPLIASKEPRRHPRVAARWLLRYLEEDDDATID